MNLQKSLNFRLSCWVKFIQEIKDFPIFTPRKQSPLVFNVIITLEADESKFN